MKEKNIITSDDILGKEAVDPNGSVLGTVVKLHIDKDHKKITGITIDLGFMKPDLFVGIEYIKNFGVDTIFLTRMPTNKVKGMNVYTWNGIEVGKVKKVNLYRTNIKEIIVHSKKGIFSKEKKTISIDHIDKIGENIVLKQSYKS